MTATKIITLTTDFGLADTFVGQMKGVILSICPDVRIVDLTHEVPRHDVHAGAFQLETAYASFPHGTVHVAVVDPGVGTARRPIVLRTESYTFVAPDNGLLTRVLDAEERRGAYVIVESHYLAAEVSATFHGRDVFAPAAAWLARGVDPSLVGPPAGDLQRLSRPAVEPRPGARLRCRVLAIDRFGNATVDLHRRDLEPALGDRGAKLRLIAPGGEAHGLRSTYADPGGDDPFLLFNSAGYLEAARFGGSAARRLELRVGLAVEIVVPAA